MSKWKTVRLGDVCILEKGQQIDTSLLDDSKTYRYINGGIKESGYFDKFNTSGESVLISEGGASCGYINYVNEDIWCGCHCYRLHDIKVFPKYLFHALKANQQRIMALRTGSAMPNIQKSTIQKFQLKIHDDLTTQKNISTMLDKCDELIEKYKKMLEKYDTLIKSRFIEMFGDPVINTRNWQIKSIGDSCFVTKLAGFEYSKYIHYSDIGDVVMVKAQNVKNGKLNNKELSYISNEVSDSLPRSQLAKNDVVMTYVGANIGDVAVIDDKYKYHLAPNVAKIRPNVTIYNSHFLVQLLMLLRNYIVGNSADTAKAAIGMEKIRQLKLPIPPIDFQNDFASFVQQIDKSKFAVQKSLEKAETLYKSLMQEYFG